ncbi:hypothetical protein CYY_002406 [Polysphondylium violaceum]|uniref:C3H1-type domain-containing protein n=1 Tax=Polysphondylium violaceum TaxID=133409 RepID=A0A8J4V6Y2_9MYCE|nr:hypothetical protein CYY_002406 [Polysphondylium violaceum]
MDTNVQRALQEIVKRVPENLNSFIIYDYGVKNLESVVEKIKEHSQDFFLVIIADFQSVNEKKEKEIQDLFAKLHKPYCHFVRALQSPQSIKSVPDHIGTTLATLIHEKWPRIRKIFYFISKDERFESYCAALNMSQKEHVTPVSLNIDEFLKLKFVGGDRIENNLHPRLEHNPDWFKRNKSTPVGRWLSFLGKKDTETEDEYKARKNEMWKLYKIAAGENFNVNITTDYVKPVGVRENIEKHHSDTRFSVYVDKEGEDHIIPFLLKLPEQFHFTIWSFKSEADTKDKIHSSSDHKNITKGATLVVYKSKIGSGNFIYVKKSCIYGKDCKFQQTCKYKHPKFDSPVSSPTTSGVNTQTHTATICKYYPECNFKNNCRYLHPLS